MNQETDPLALIHEGLSSGKVKSALVIYTQADGQMAFTTLGTVQPVEALGQLELAKALVLQSMRGQQEPSRIARVN